MRLTLTLAFLSTACLDHKQGTVDPGVTCRAEPLTLVASGVLLDAQPDAWDPAMSGFFAAADAVVFTRPGTSGGNAPDDAELTRVEPGGEAAQVTFNDEPDAVVDARGDATLVQRGGWDLAVRALVLIDEDGEHVLARGAEANVNGSYGSETRRIGDGIVAWSACSDELCTTRRVLRFDGTTTVLATAPRSNAFVLWGPEVEGRSVVWAERDDPWATGAFIDTPWRIKRAVDGETRLLAEGVALTERPVPVGADVLVPTVDGLMAIDIVSGAQAIIGEASCRPVASDAGRAIVTCDGGHALWDGAMRSIAPGARLVLSPRVAGDVLGWVEYDDAAAGCHDTDVIGRVMIAPVHAPEEAIEVAAIGIGCRCCGAFWPEPTLVFGDDFVAWNYAQPASEPWRVIGLGWARFTLTRCD